MIEHVYRRAAAARGLERVVVLTDDERVAAAVADFGGNVAMTPVGCASGTDRIAWAARAWSEDVVINVQGDEPLLEPELIERLAAHLATTPDDQMATFAATATRTDLTDPAKVKVVVDLASRALYFSRAAIPHPRPEAPVVALRHVGLYGYRRATLLRLAALEPTALERAESLEQLRALEHGIAIRVLRCDHSGFGVDTEDDLERAEDLLQATETEGSDTVGSAV
jgi:3-deoxy-manno-octulosonate cytidylyltransferase (CMP-KDO synthetase)